MSLLFAARAHTRLQFIANPAGAYAQRVCRNSKSFRNLLPSPNLFLLVALIIFKNKRLLVRRKLLEAFLQTIQSFFFAGGFRFDGRGSDWLGVRRAWCSQLVESRAALFGSTRVFQKDK